MKLDRTSNDVRGGPSYDLRAIGPVLKAKQSLLQIARLLRQMDVIVHTIIHITIKFRGRVDISMLLRVSPNILVVDAPSTELIAQHLHATQEISIVRPYLPHLFYTHVTRRPSASISRMNSRAGMALYRAMILGFHFCQSSAFGGRRSAAG